MKKSEQKKQLVDELSNLYAAIDVVKLHDFSDSKDAKDWLAEVASILKNLDESDYQEFIRLRKSLYPLVERRTRISAANEIDGFVRQKVAEYKRYDFSNLDEDQEKKQESGPIGILNNGRNNIFNNNKFINLGVGIQDNGENTLAIDNKFMNINKENKSDRWYQKWWIQLIIGSFLFALLAQITGGYITNILGITHP